MLVGLPVQNVTGEDKMYNRVRNDTWRSRKDLEKEKKKGKKKKHPNKTKTINQQ